MTVGSVRRDFAPDRAAQFAHRVPGFTAALTKAMPCTYGSLVTAAVDGERRYLRACPRPDNHRPDRTRRGLAARMPGHGFVLEVVR